MKLADELRRWLVLLAAVVAVAAVLLAAAALAYLLGRLFGSWRRPW